MKPEKTQAASL